MVKIDDYVFYKNLPELDLHGMNRYQAMVLIDEFINNSITLKYRLVKIIHGYGTGIIKKTVSDCLKKNHNVLEYKTDIYNGGVIIVLLKS